MIRYKVLDINNNVVGITTNEDLRYIQYNEDHSGILIARDLINAVAISVNGLIYSLNEHNTEFPFAKLVIIGKSEFQRLEELLALNTQEEIPSSPIIQEEDTPDVSTLQLAIMKKIDSMKTECNQVITNGIELTLSDNNIYHFDLSVEDQLNLSSIEQQLLQGAELIPFHAKNDEFKYYHKLDLETIIFTARKHILYHNVYFNCLRDYIKSIRSIKELDTITYGVDIPSKFKSEILIQLENDY